MRALVIAGAVLFFVTAAYGQGQVVINNRVPAEGIDARFILAPTVCGDPALIVIGSPDWSVTLLGGPHGIPTSQLVPLDPPSTTFLGAAGTPTAGYINQVTATVPNVPPGSTADITLRLVGPESFSQDFGPIPVMLGGGLVPPPLLPLGMQPLVVGQICPEPSPLLLSALGLVALVQGLFRSRGRPFKVQ